GHAYTEPDVMQSDARAVRARTGRPFAINLFAAPTPAEPPMDLQQAAINGLRSHFERLGLAAPARVAPPYAPERARQIEAVCDIRPGVLTVHLGDMTPEVVGRLRDLGVRIGGSATSVREDRRIGHQRA